MSIIPDRIGHHKVLLTTNHNHYNLRKKTHLFEKISPVKTLSKVRNSSFWNSSRFVGQVVGAMGVVINSVIGGLAEWT